MRWLSLWQLTTQMEGIGEAGEVLAGEGSASGFVDASIEAARGALWAFSLERDARWFAGATRALHAAAGYLHPLEGFPETKLAYPDHVYALAMFIRTYLHWLLSLPAFARRWSVTPTCLSVAPAAAFSCRSRACGGLSAYRRGVWWTGWRWSALPRTTSCWLY
jgi:hypothetical protein